MAPLSFRNKRKPIRYAKFQCADGPLAGRTITLEENSDGRTFTFAIGNKTGHYQKSTVVTEASTHLRWVTDYRVLKQA